MDKSIHRKIIQKYSIITLLLIWMVIPVFAFDIQSTKFSTRNGLSDNTVRQIYQDTKGYVWLATFNGVTRYDGYTMKKYAIENGSAMAQETQVRRMMEDSHGFLWLMCYNDAVSCLNLQEDKFVKFLPDGTDERYRYIKETSDGVIWLWGEQGARRFTYENGELTSVRYDRKVLESDQIYQIGNDSLDRTFICAASGLWCLEKAKLYKLDASRQYQWMTFTDKATLLVAINGDIITVNENQELHLIGHLDGVSKRSDLPGAVIYNNQWHITTPAGGEMVDLATLNISEAPATLKVPFGQSIVDNQGDIWFYNETGILYFLEKNENRLKPLHLIPANKMKLIDQERYSIARDRTGKAWITTGCNGLFIYNPHTEKLDHLTTQGNNFQVLPTDNLLCSALDNLGNVWIGTSHAGVAVLKTNQDGIQPLNLPFKDNLQHAVRMIKRMNDGTILISSRDGRLYHYSSDLNHCSISDRNAVIYDLAVDKAGNRWEATRSNGLFRNGIKVGHDINLTSNDIFCIYPDTKGRIWVGTFGAGLDVLVPDKENGTYQTYNFLNENYGQRRVRYIFEDKKGNIWVATNIGVYRFHPDALLKGQDKGILFNHSNGNLRSNLVHCMCEDAYGRIWIGCSTSGISILDFAEDASRPKITHLGTDNGIMHDNVVALVKENDDLIWAATLFGVSRINIKTLGIESFVFLSSPTANVHTPNSAIMLDKNKLLLGTEQGAYTVNLKELSKRTHDFDFKVTNFKVNGENRAFVADGNRLSLKEGIYYLKLPYNQSSISFDFSTFDFEWPKQTKFRYRLQPFDKDWGEPTIDNTVDLKNLPPREYTLSVEAAGADGIWTNKFICIIQISPPWWASWWAKSIYFLLIFTGAYLIFSVVNRIHYLDYKVKAEQQLTDYKLEFFTNISHEFRTPLTLIQVSLEKLHEKMLSLKENNPGVSLNGLSHPLATLEKNSRRMSSLIDELLLFRKVEKNKLILYPEATDVILFLRGIYENFREEAESKHLTYRFSTNEDSFQMNVDRNALDKITNNLISNALKYTREGGMVECDIHIKRESQKLEMNIIDNGVGIAPDKKEQLFSRFMQSAMSRNSIGVGLHLTFELVQLHGGTICHTDNPKGGSIFTVCLPTEMPAAKNKIQEGIGRPSFEKIFTVEDEINTEVISSDVNRTKNKMLIIDDDADIRLFLSNEFAPNFTVFTASDGQSCLDVARNNDICIIICDVMMPDMSGFEVTRLLKEDFATSHIPIIQLTALSNDDSQIEGITSGADAYITKPFNLKFLKTRVAKLIEQRANLFAKFSATPTLVPPQLPMNDKDKEFADRLVDIVNKQLDNVSYSADDFASDMAMGRTIFYRKVKGITGYAPKEYLRVMRMKKAAEMLLSTDMTITEISYRVGISDPAYFNKCFKAQFGKAPSIYQKENARKPL